MLLWSKICTTRPLLGGRTSVASEIRPSIARETWERSPHRRESRAYVEPVRPIELLDGSGVHFPIGGFEEGRTVRSFAEEEAIQSSVRSSTGDRSKIHPSANMTRRDLYEAFRTILCGIGPGPWPGSRTDEYSLRFRSGSSPSPQLRLFRTEIRSDSSASTLSGPPTALAPLVAQLAILWCPLIDLFSSKYR